ncbi:MAG: VWA domain-containing protein, partial [Pseudomonadota bacterium]
FEGLEGISIDAVLEAVDIPAGWLEKMAEKHLSEEERAEIDALGGFDKLMETLKKRLEEQKDRHQGGNKWIGTAGTSPFGAYGYNPEGVRIGQKESRHQRAVKVWDKREFKNLDDTVELGTRNIKVALKRLRRWARDGAAEELDLNGTIRATAEHGYLDVQTRPERRNAVKVLLFLDVGGSMDPHIKVVEELFSAAKSEFKHLEYFYFHNCLYEGVWRDNRRRWDAQTPTHEILRTYGPDYKCIFVGDASMSPYEVAYPGGANEHWNQEAGQVWLHRARDQWASNLWINPVPEKYWDYTHSIGMIREIFGTDAMVPMTLEGLSRGMRALTR